MAMAGSGGISQVGPSAFRNPEKECRGPTGIAEGGTTLKSPGGTRNGAEEGAERAHPDKSAPRVISPSLGDGEGPQELAWIPLQTQGPDNPEAKTECWSPPGAWVCEGC